MESEAVEITEHRIPDANFVSFTEKFEKLARRARKLGVGAVTYKVVRVERTQIIRETRQAADWSGNDLDPREREVSENVALPAGWRVVGQNTYHVVVVEGDRPKLNGWRFVGTLQSLKDDEGKVINILRNAPGETIPAKYRSAEQWCDQCRTRRYRIDTYIVQHDDGRTAQVGSDCLKDFLGHANPEAVARFCEYLIELDALTGSEGEGGERSGEGAIYLPYVLVLTAARVRVKGWMSRSKAREINGEADTYNDEAQTNEVARESGEQLPEGAKVGRKRGVDATADKVTEYLDKKTGAKKMRDDSVEITEADEAEAEAALAWIRSQDYSALQTGDNDYLWNLYAACARSDMSLRTLGIVSSLIAAYQRHIGRERERKERNEKWANSQFVGTVKERKVFRVKLIDEPQHYANDFGGSYLTRLEDEAGNQIVWWASNLIRVETGEFEEVNSGQWNHEAQAYVMIRQPVTRQWEVGEWLNLKATVVKHEERNGVKQTTINRAALDVPKVAKVKKERKA